MRLGHDHRQPRRRGPGAHLRPHLPRFAGQRSRSRSICSDRASRNRSSGERVWFDLTRDVGLVTIRTPGPVAVARLAPPDYKSYPGHAGGERRLQRRRSPTVQHSQVNKLNRFQGPPNLTVAGQPVNGRSGGGLFSSEGYVIGVCNARDPDEQQGLFAAPAAIYAELDRDQLAFVYKSPSGSLDGFSPGASPSVQPTPGPAGGATHWAAAGASPPTPGPVYVGQCDRVGRQLALPPHEQAALEELRRQAKEGAKIIIVVCPRGNPEGKRDVIVVDHASQGFVRQVRPKGDDWTGVTRTRRRWSCPSRRRSCPARAR